MHSDHHKSLTRLNCEKCFNVLTLLHSDVLSAVGLKLMKIHQNQLLQLCMAHTMFTILVTVQLYTVMPEVCSWLTNEKQIKTDIRSTDQ